MTDAPAADQLRRKIVEFATHGYCASKIAKTLYGDTDKRPNIHYHLKQLTAAYVLRKIPGSKSPRLYEPGDNYDRYLTLADGRQNMDQEGWVNAGGQVLPEGHNFVFKFRVIDGPVKRVPWSKAWTPNNREADVVALKRDVAPRALAYGSDIHRVWRLSPGDDLTKTVTVKEIISRRNHVMVIYMAPEDFGDTVALDGLGKLMFARAIQTAGLMGRLFGYVLQAVIDMSRPHFAFEADPDLVRDMKRYNVRTPDIWADESHGRHHIETSNIQVANTLVTLPGTLEDLKRAVERQAGLMATIDDRIAHLFESAKMQVSFNNHVLGVFERLATEGLVDPGAVDEVRRQGPVDSPEVA